MISITVGNGRDIRGQLPQQFHAQYDALAATGMSQHMIGAAMAELTGKIAVPRPRADGASDRPAVAKPKAKSVAAPKAAAPVPTAVAQRRAANDLSAMSVAELEAYAATQNAIAAFHRGQLDAAPVDPRTAELDRIFGTGPKTEPGVVMVAGGALQVFGAPVPVTPRKQAAPAAKAAHYAAPSIPAPPPGMPTELQQRIEAAFGDHKIADGVRITSDGIQQFGVK